MVLRSEGRSTPHGRWAVVGWVAVSGALSLAACGRPSQSTTGRPSVPRTSPGSSVRPAGALSGSVQGTWTIVRTGPPPVGTRILPVQFGLAVTGGNAAWSETESLFPAGGATGGHGHHRQHGIPGSSERRAASCAVHPDGAGRSGRSAGFRSPVWQASISGGPTEVQSDDVAGGAITGNQKDNAGAQVPVGAYVVRFAGPNLGEVARYRAHLVASSSRGSTAPTRMTQPSASAARRGWGACPDGALP